MFKFIIKFKGITMNMNEINERLKEYEYKTSRGLMRNLIPIK